MTPRLKRRASFVVFLTKRPCWRLSDRFRVLRGAIEIQLGAIEFRLLRHLFENLGRVFSREDLITAAWPNNVHVSARTVDVHMSRLRKSLLKLGLRGIIRTVRSGGYMLDDKNGS